MRSGRGVTPQAARCHKRKIPWQQLYCTASQEDLSKIHNTSDKLDIPDDHLLTLPKPERGEVDVLKELSNSHEIDETVSFLPTGGTLPPEALREEQVRDKMGRIGFDDGEDHQWEDNVARDWCRP